MGTIDGRFVVMVFLGKKFSYFREHLLVGLSSGGGKWNNITIFILHTCGVSISALFLIRYASIDTPKVTQFKNQQKTC